MSLVHEYKPNTNLDAILDGQEEYATYVRRSYMYEFIMLFILAIIVLVITIRNLASDTVTMGGYIICCIILALFLIAVIMYIIKLIGSVPPADYPANGSDSGPVIRIHYI